MAEIVNLKAARKARERVAAKAAAEANAAKHGRTKALIALEKARAAKADKSLDGHQRDGSD